MYTNTCVYSYIYTYVRVCVCVYVCVCMCVCKYVYTVCSGLFSRRPRHMKKDLKEAYRKLTDCKHFVVDPVFGPKDLCGVPIFFF